MEACVVSIHIAERAGGPLTSLAEAKAVAGRGLEGDRYFAQQGTFSSHAGPDRELTLIESEAVEAFAVESGVALRSEDTRRNIVCRGVRLNDLVGREFSVGAVRLRGLRLSEPCDHLAKLTDRRILPGLVHRAGIRAQILLGGTIRVGDVILAEEPAATG